VLCVLCAAAPALAMLAVGKQPFTLSGTFHFVAVGGSALAATAASIVLTVIGARQQDGRTVLVGTAFAAMAALLFLHGLASPGVIVGYNGLIALSGAATLPVGAAVLGLSSMRAFRGPRAVLPLVALQTFLLLAIVAVGVAGLARPSLVPGVPQAGSNVAIAIACAGLALYGTLCFRALDTFILTRRGTDAIVVVGLAFLGTALVAALTLQYDQLGWWMGHAFELFGLALVAAAVGLDLGRTYQSRPLTGGVPAADLVAAEEAFLGSRVRALTLKLGDKDEYTEEHTRRVALLAVLVGEDLGLPPSRLRSLATGGLLHDIGKLAIPDAILKKPGPLDDEEYGVIKRHPEWGHHLLGEIGDFGPDVRRLVLDHHERLDGTGYPRGLTQAQLDLETRILMVCDVYDALCSTRVYRDAWTHERAMDLLRKDAGSLFDRRCVEALDRVTARQHGAMLSVAV